MYVLFDRRDDVRIEVKGAVLQKSGGAPPRAGSALALHGNPCGDKGGDIVMKSAWMSSACALGVVSLALVGCNRKTNERGEPQGQTPSATEQQQAEQRQAEQQRAEQQRAEQQRAEEQRKADEQQKQGERRSIGGGPGATTNPSAALSGIAAARCDREIRCKNVGPDGKYKSRGECIVEMQKDKRDDFSVASCPAVDTKKLEGCVQEIQREKCGNPLDVFNRYEMCKSGSLCVK
jgi:hypothetical protein